MSGLPPAARRSSTTLWWPQPLAAHSGGAHILTWEASPWSDGSHQLLSWGEAPQSGHGLSCLLYTMLCGQSVYVRESKMDQRSWIPYHQQAYIVQPHTSMTIVKRSLVPSPPDFALQLWRKPELSPQLRDKLWEWPGKRLSQTVRLKQKPIHLISNVQLRLCSNIIM